MEYEVFTGDLPYLTTVQMREVDRAMIEDLNIGLIQMMENAGRNLAQLARGRFFDYDPQGRKVIVRPAPEAMVGVPWSVPGGCTTTGPR